MMDSFDLQRFIDAQAPVIERVMAELAGGRKQSHWMWFVFPQIRGLGRSATAVRYALEGADEARAYLAHPLLAERLLACCHALLALDEVRPESVLGSIDALKLRSSMTLFAAISDEPLFKQLLLKYYGGEPDAATLAILDEELKANDRL